MFFLRQIFILQFFWMTSVFCVDLSPWIDKPFTFVPELKYTFQTNDHIRDHLFALCGNFAAFGYGVDVEASLADTKHHALFFDAFQLTLRKELLEDTVGDVMQLAIGGTVTLASSRALHEPSLFYHGTKELALHLGMGKEFSKKENWVYRLYQVFEIGSATEGSPWLRLELQFEKQLQDFSIFRAGLIGLMGLGKREDFFHFHGYGSIKHRSLDLILRYQLPPFDWGVYSLEYAYRVASLNFPKNVQRFQFQFIDWVF